MIKHKSHRLSLIGLCLTAACALMAFSASAAQAEANSEWMIGGTNIKLGGKELTSIDVAATFHALTFENGLDKEGKLAKETKNVALLLSETAVGAPIWVGCEEAKGTSIHSWTFDRLSVIHQMQNVD